MKLLRYIQSNIGSLIFIVFFGIIFLNADAKTWVIKGLMSTGLYNADVPTSPTNKLTSAEKFMKKNSYQLPVFVTASPIPKEIFDGSLPTTLIVGPDGNIVFQHSGMADYDRPEVLDFLNNLIE